VIYLLSQMSFIILLAAIAGGALGWVFHRMRSQQKLGDLQRVISQQQQQVKQAHTEVSMLAQDYDELKQNSTSTIENLRGENRQIPNLHQNLEKSQLLVRQLMQKHEAQIREYASENEILKGKVKHVDDRERALNKLQADLDRNRRDLNESRKDAKAKPSEKVSVATQKVETPIAEAPKDKATAETSAKTKPKTVDALPEEITKRGAALNTKTNTTSQSIAELTAKAQAKAAEEKAIAAAAAQVEAEGGMDMSADVSGEAGSLTIALAEADVVLAAIDRKRELTIEDDEVIDASELDVDIEFADEEEELEPLFDLVDQHDDLQTIFGIGPVTERGLNQLGITSYSQLAELKRHDIEKIANALEIVPGKIERENWVGNARRTLEDVLEEL